MWRIRYSHVLKTLYKESDIVMFMKIGRLCWAGFVIRMDITRVPSRLMNTNFVGKRFQCGQRKRNRQLADDRSRPEYMEAVFRERPGSQRTVPRQRKKLFCPRIVKGIASFFLTVELEPYEIDNIFVMPTESIINDIPRN